MMEIMFGCFVVGSSNCCVMLHIAILHSNLISAVIIQYATNLSLVNLGYTLL